MEVHTRGVEWIAAQGPSRTDMYYNYYRHLPIHGQQSVEDDYPE